MIHRKTTSEEPALVLEEGEGYTLEFKQNVNADLAKELVAFANASGGRIFISVDDDSQIVGCNFSNAFFPKPKPWQPHAIRRWSFSLKNCRIQN